MTLAEVILGLVTLQRLGELVLSKRNTDRLRARGAHEVAAGHYPLIVAPACRLAGRALASRRRGARPIPR